MSPDKPATEFQGENDLSRHEIQLWLFILIAISVWTSRASAQFDSKPYFPPERISVQPVIFCPTDESFPPRSLDAIVMKHLKWTQRRYGELLGTSFEIEETVKRIRGHKNLAEYRKRDGDAVLDFSSELLDSFGFNRFNCPHVFLTVVVNSKLEGQPDYAIDVQTNAGASFGSKVENCVVGYFRPSPGPEITYDAGSMWSSDPVSTTATLDLTFPFPVELTRIRLYSGHSDQYHPVLSFSCSIPDAGSALRTLATSTLQGFDGEVSFSATESQRWHLELTPGESKMVVVRGLRFYSGETEIFPPQLCLVD